jgi:hypothetical protein
MVGLFHRLVLPALLASMILSQQSAYAQPGGPDPVTKAPTPTNYDYNPLPNLPRPAEAPASLLQPAPAEPPYSCAPLPGPYFEREPLFDPPALPQPGWFARLDVTFLKPSVQNRLSGQPQIGNQPPGQVNLPSASLDWTAAPYLQVGYRLPSGFGEIALAYRGFGTRGTSTFADTDGPASLHSRLDVNQVDLDYLSREYSLWPHCEMKWHVGVRLTYLYFDSRADENFDDAAAGSGIVETSVSNNYWGIGPHAGVELARHIDGAGLSFVASVDATTLLGRVRQGFTETDVTGATGLFRNSGSQQVPVLDFKAGLNWQPPQYPQWGVFLGYEYEYWWNVGRLSTTPDSRGQMKDQGIVVRAAYNF